MLRARAVRLLDASSTLTRSFAELCPHDCSGHGYCYSGTCFCSAGFAGDDCGQKEMKSSKDAAMCSIACVNKCVAACKSESDSCYVHCSEQCNQECMTS